MTSEAIPDRRRYRAAIGFVCLVLAGMAAFSALRLWPVAIICIAAIIGLVRGVRWGRRTALVLLWLLLISGVMLLTPPERVDGYEPVVIPIGTLVLYAVAMGTPALAGLHLLGRYRKAFRSDWF